MRTDDMVREALADLAPTAPADNTALSGVHRAIGRRRRRRHVAQAVAAVALVATAVGTGALLLRAEDSKVQTGNQGSTTTTPTPTTPDTAEGGSAGRISFGSVSFQLPEGWHQIDHRFTGGEEAQGESMCIGPLPNEYPRWDDCGGLLIYQGDFIPGNEGQPYEPDSPWGWYHNTDVAQCPFSPAPLEGGTSDDVRIPNEGMAPIDSGTRAVGDHTANYNRWNALCESGDSFQPQAWYLPQSKVLILDVTGHPETEDLLASFEFDE
jgi:hypothetical protein